MTERQNDRTKELQRDRTTEQLGVLKIIDYSYIIEYYPIRQLPSIIQLGTDKIIPLISKIYNDEGYSN
jgi:hypothetical protein